MAIAVAGQHAYDAYGNEATLTEEFLSEDFRTWNKGLVSINHEPNQDWVKAKLYDPEYDSERKLVICSFSGIPDWVKSLIYSDDYKGLSQECWPTVWDKNYSNVCRGFGTGVTIVTDPYSPAATQEMGVGLRPELAAFLKAKYPTQIGDTMADKSGGGTPAISVEAFESTVSENVQLKSQIKTLETEKKTLGEELASTRTEYEHYKAGETDRNDLAYSKGKTDGRAELLEENERNSIIEEFTATHGETFAKRFLATNPSLESIKVLTAGKKVDLSKDVGSSQDAGNHEEGRSYEELDREWNSKLGRT